MYNKELITRYFTAEKTESLVFIALGISGIIAAAIFYFFVRNSFCKGAAIPALLLGTVMLTVGFTVYTRSDADIARNITALETRPADIAEKELPRMKAVMNSFTLYRWMEIIFILTGLALFIFLRQSKPFWAGVGISLATMAASALIADYFAEERGRAYLDAVEKFTGID